MKNYISSLIVVVYFISVILIAFAGAAIKADYGFVNVFLILFSILFLDESTSNFCAGTIACSLLGFATGTIFTHFYG